MASSAPDSLLARCTTSDVLSAPVGGGSFPGRPTTTNRVTADSLSATCSASTSSPYRSALSGETSAASNPGSWPGAVSASSAPAAAVDVAGTCTAAGRLTLNQPRHCAHACGWVDTRVTSASTVPARAASTNDTGTTTSRSSTSASPVASVSSVAVTPPSTEFSIGTTA